MDINSVIKLKDRYEFFQEQEHGIILLDKEEKKIILRINYKFNFEFDQFKQAMQQLHTVAYLIEQDYKALVSKLLKEYLYVFEELDREETYHTLTVDNQKDVVDRLNFVETFELSQYDLSQTVFVLHQVSNLSVALAETLLTHHAKGIILCSDGGKVEPVDLLHSKVFQFEDLRKDKGEKVREYFQNDPHVEVYGSEEWQTAPYDVAQQYIHIVLNERLRRDQLLAINDFVQEKDHLCLMNDINPDQLLIGPLVIPKESACMRCLLQQDEAHAYFKNRQAHMLSSDVFHHYVIGFILRIVYHIKGEQLRFLAEDVQVPINQIFSITKENLLGEIVPVYKQVACQCKG